MGRKSMRKGRKGRYGRWRWRLVYRGYLARVIVYGSYML